MNIPGPNTAAIVFLLVAIIACIWLSSKGRYHIFFFCLCLCGPLNYILYLVADKIINNSVQGKGFDYLEKLISSHISLLADYSNMF